MASEEDLTQCTGKHEVQECLEGQGELDLHTHLKDCKKNPGHSEFVPINNFSVDHFPPGFQDIKLCNFIKVLAHLTVRIVVNFTSPDRPEYIPDTKDPYPCYNTRGQNSLRTGTGTVWGIIHYTEGKNDYRTCPCPECDHSDTPSKEWWKIQVLTARHVVFDESEARQSRCRLWYNDDQSPVVNIYGCSISSPITDNDICSLDCATHDFILADQLEGMTMLCAMQCMQLSRTYGQHKNVHRLAIIVSHPHGCSKHVSVGRWIQRQYFMGDRCSRYTYTTCTCPGSSGAMVYRLGCNWISHLHSGANPDVETLGLNYSGIMIDLDSACFVKKIGAGTQ